MPETYGLPEPELTPEEEAARWLNEALAGQSAPRTVLLYLAVALGIMLTATPLMWIGGLLAFSGLLLLLASDPRLS